ncbi:RNA polymerase sigma factor [Planomonospora venezuelensis]|nr:RNA polymerase sigma factor [Planomonospora venezuelensis]
MTYYDLPDTKGGAVDRDSVGRLFQAAADGDAAAWKALVEGLSPLVWSVVRAHGLAEADGHEVYQTTWFRLAQHLRRIREPDGVGSWLASTARHECLKVIRSARRLSPTDDPEILDRAGDGRTPEQAVIDSEEAEAEAERIRQVWAAFQELGENCRRLLRVLMASPPPSYREVSAALGIAVGSIGPIRQRCLRRLRARLAERGVR